jgi:hypothetical protein
MVVVDDDQDNTMSNLQLSTRSLLANFSLKSEQLKQCNNDLKNLLNEGLNYSIAFDLSKKFFKENEVTFLAIDGTQSQDEKLDLLVFCSAAFGYKGKIHFHPDGIRFPSDFEGNKAISISSAIPVHEEDIASIVGRATEAGLEVDPLKLPSSLMQLAEYYMAVRELEKDPNLKILFLDRMPSIDLPHLIGNSSELLESDKSILIGMDTPYGKVSLIDLELARMLHPNAKLRIPEARSQLIKYKAISWILEDWDLDNDFAKKDKISYEQLLVKIGAKSSRLRKLMRDLERFNKRFTLFSLSTERNQKQQLYSNQQFIYKDSIDSNLKNYWKRVYHASVQVIEHIFNTTQAEHPLRYKQEIVFSDNQEKDNNTKGTLNWITEEDLNTLVLIMIYSLVRKAWDENVLILGIVKDIGARELIKTVVPLLQNLNLLSFKNSIPNFNSDRMLLQVNSIINGHEILAPWSTFEYDTCFKTMAPNSIPDKFAYTLSTRKDGVKGAFKNLISVERLFVKSYIQLWNSKTNPAMRSHVFAYDRPAYPGFDTYGEIRFKHEDGNVFEDIIPILHFNQKENSFSHLVMAILYSLAQDVIPECLGHNYPLFLADKKAKIFFKTTRNAYLSAVELELSKNSLDQQPLFNRRFRDYRSSIEKSRTKGA